MAGTAARFRGKGKDLLRVENGGLAGRQVVSQHDDRFLQMLQLLATVAKQVSKDEFLDVKQVDGPGREVAVVNAFQRLGMLAHDPADRILRGKTLLENQIFDL